MCKIKFKIVVMRQKILITTSKPLLKCMVQASDSIREAPAKIDLILEREHYSERDLAEMLGVTNLTINNWRRGKCHPKNIFAFLRIIYWSDE
jgi:DNA-binding transcriptional regulator YiaG